MRAFCTSACPLARLPGQAVLVMEVMEALVMCTVCSKPLADTAYMHAVSFPAGLCVQGAGSVEQTTAAWAGLFLQAASIALSSSQFAIVLKKTQVLVAVCMPCWIVVGAHAQLLQRLGPSEHRGHLLASPMSVCRVMLRSMHRCVIVKGGVVLVQSGCNHI